MHHGTSVAHVAWCMSGSLIRGGGETVPGIPGPCATRNFAHLVKGQWIAPLITQSTYVIMPQWVNAVWYHTSCCVTHGKDERANGYVYHLLRNPRRIGQVLPHDFPILILLSYIHICMYTHFLLKSSSLYNRTKNCFHSGQNIRK